MATVRHSGTAGCAITANKVGLDPDYLNRKVYYLSGGEQQKVAITRVLPKPFELILADEPTGNLDEKNAKEIVKLFKTIQRRCAFICILFIGDLHFRKPYNVGQRITAQ
ncbi:MAG TPA: ATP-binding cassette domain-containing protein [Thermoclostridium sp.]|nr:ATP-binding cassette domain-containing protein [Thermoclostridium sp.]